MKTFHYKAKQGPGKIVRGDIEAENLNSAVQKIIQTGCTPIDVVASEKRKSSRHTVKISSPFLSRKIRTKDIVAFTRQMSDLTEASVPIVRALKLIGRQTENQHMQSLVKELHTVLEDGGSFTQALRAHPQYFSNLYVELVHTGELSGTLGPILSRLAAYLEKEQETRSKVISSLLYPSVILAVGVLTVFVLFSFLIPRISVMFEDLGQELPWQTVMLMQVSFVFARFWWVMVLLIVGAAYAFVQYLKTSKGRYSWDTFQLRLPFLGGFIRKVELGRVNRTLSALNASGLDIATSLTVTGATIENLVLREEMKQVPQEVIHGGSLHMALKKCSFFPEMAINMISVGEETGRLDQAFSKVADIFERESEEIMKMVITLLGPTVLIGIVSIVGFIVIALLLPIFQMNLLVE